MDSVLADESASNVCGNVESSILGRSGPCGLSITVTGEDILKAYQLMDVGSYQKFISLISDHQRTVNRTVSAQSCALRKGSSAVSAGSNKSSGVSAGSVVSRGSRLAGIRAAASWRKAALPEGLCYARTLRDSSVESVTSRFQKWPSVASLLQLPASAVKPVDQLRGLLVEGGSSAAHVNLPGANGFPLLPELARVAQGLKTPLGTFGAVLRASGVEHARTAVGLTARTALGGLRSKPMLGVRSSVPDGPFVFLAGTDEGAAGPGWREGCLPLFGELDVLAVRRADLLHLNVPFVECAEWSRTAMRRAAAVVFNFLPGDFSAASTLDLGYAAASGFNVFVHCDDGSHDGDSVREFCLAHGIPVCGSLAEAARLAVSACEAGRRVGSGLFDPREALLRALGSGDFHLRGCVGVGPLSFSGLLVARGASRVSTSRDGFVLVPSGVDVTLDGVVLPGFGIRRVDFRRGQQVALTRTVSGVVSVPVCYGDPSRLI